MLSRTLVVSGLTALLAVAIACGGSGERQLPAAPSDTGGFNGANISAPAPETPTNDQEADTMRPTLRVTNATSNGGEPRTYDFQISDNEAFSTLTANRAGVPEGSDGKTTYTPSVDLAPTTRYFWRARAVQGNSTGPWSSVARFRTKIGGYNRPGELYDPLTQGLTVGTRVGSTTFVAGQGVRLDTQNSYVRYDLPATLSSGEFSVEVRGLRPNHPTGKLKILSMSSTRGDLVGDPYELSAQYRGSNGNPSNSISFKAAWGSQGVLLEPNLATRSASVVRLDPSHTYLWQVTWSGRTFRLVVRDNSAGGRVVYNRSATAPTGTYAPNPHYAYLGATSGVFGSDIGSWDTAVFRNVWLSNKPRPATLGNSLQE